MNMFETDELIRRYAEKFRHGVDDQEIRISIFNEVKDIEKAFFILTAAFLLAKN